MGEEGERDEGTRGRIGEERRGRRGGHTHY